jgi:hypothetical protein
VAVSVTAEYGLLRLTVVGGCLRDMCWQNRGGGGGGITYISVATYDDEYTVNPAKIIHL